ncbi:glycosyltransferase family 4 protein [Pengzhenrongella sicca]|uniref:Glycosyltransferase family 4 protein n=1 Tax=Pengzhenrongella sicca TaxID=2819238 RepID=A0A8A4ZEB1_9MICO|nr:glycosyltransferase family 1 protein [Pengzhenrongella sicca]QTE30244.1 glycosyltransferase family 4 protein [Pengzhenrongella sicca]
MSTRPNTTLSVAVTVEQLWQPSPGGSGTYIRELTEALALRDDITLLGVGARHPSAPPDPWGLPSDLRLHLSRLPRVALYESWNTLRFPRAAPRAEHIDVLHATTWAIPPRTAPLVVTVHDLAFLREPAHFTARGNAFFRRALDIVRREADMVIAVSEATRADCLRAGIEPERVRVVHHGATVPDVPVTAVRAFRARHNLVRPYVFWCGTAEPRKNLEGLLAAYALVVASGNELDLVLAGPVGWGDASARLAQAAAALPAARVHRLGILSESDLHAGYAGASVFCFPSHWEGFGLPVLEAMSHGVPVVTSRGTAMAEICGTGALLADAADPVELARAIISAATDRHDALAANARVQAAAFTWQRCAAETTAAYRAAADRAGLSA